MRHLRGTLITAIVMTTCAPIALTKTQTQFIGSMTGRTFASVSSDSNSANVELGVWKTPESASPILFPIIDGEAPRLAVERYMKLITTNSQLSPLLQSEALPSPVGEFEKLSNFKRGGATRTAIVANTFADLRADGPRMKHVYDSFTKAGAETYLIPVAADIGLNHEQAEKFRNLVAEQFSLLASLGGQDIHPRLYHESVKEARDVNYRRDRSEFLLVRTFKKRALGVFFGICRGHQMGAIADGHKLHQDLSAKGVADTNDHVNRAGTNPTEMQRWHHITIEDSLLSRFLESNKVFVNSIHHQAVSPRASAASSPVAHDGQVIESLQGKNGLSLSVQFHPEFSENVSGNREFSENGSRILSGIVSYARLKREEIRNPSRACSRIFAAGF